MPERTSGVLHLVPPYRVVVEIEADTPIPVVGVYATGLSALRVVQRAARLVLTAAASHVFPAAACPQSGIADIVEDAELAVIGDGDHLLPASVCCIRACLGAVLLQILPPLGALPLGGLGHHLVPPHALVPCFGSFEELPRPAVARR